jgi:hypothetical protein
MPMFAEPLLAILWGAFVIWTIRRLWRSPKNEYSRLVYKFGVRQGGISLWIGMVVIAPLIVNRGLVRNLQLAAFVAFLSLPLSLWAGYFWGMAFARITGLHNDHCR